MKIVARIGAGLSFAFFLLAGAMILVNVNFRGPSSEIILPAAIGFFLLGTAFFAGSLLWLAAEKWAVTPAAVGPNASRGWPRRIILGVLIAIIGALVVLPLLRRLVSAVISHPAIVP